MSFKKKLTRRRGGNEGGEIAIWIYDSSSFSKENGGLVLAPGESLYITIPRVTYEEQKEIENPILNMLCALFVETGEDLTTADVEKIIELLHDVLDFFLISDAGNVPELDISSYDVSNFEAPFEKNEEIFKIVNAGNVPILI